MKSESHKYKAKKERKIQRASFREILQSITDGDYAGQTLLVGPSKHSQELTLSTWALRFQYDAVCRALEEGVDVHMTYNASVRTKCKE